MTSETKISNRALQRLGTSDRILTLTEDTRNGRACNACYESLRDAELRKHYWNFAKEDSGALAPLSAAPNDPNYLYQFLIPSDCLRIIKPVDSSLDWQVRGRKLLTNMSNVLYLKYIKKVTDPNIFDAIFAEMLSMKMADAMCEELTQSSSKKASILDDYILLENDARKTNAFENIPIVNDDSSWVLSRG